MTSRGNNITPTTPSNPEEREAIQAIPIVDVLPGSLVISDQFGRDAISMVLTVGEDHFNMSSRGTIAPDNMGGWMYLYGEAEEKGFKAFAPGIQPKDIGFEDVQKLYDDFFTKPDHRAILDNSMKLYGQQAQLHSSRKESEV